MSALGRVMPVGTVPKADTRVRLNDNKAPRRRNITLRCRTGCFSHRGGSCKSFVHRSDSFARQSVWGGNFTPFFRAFTQWSRFGFCDAELDTWNRTVLVFFLCDVSFTDQVTAYLGETTICQRNNGRHLLQD